MNDSNMVPQAPLDRDAELDRLDGIVRDALRQARRLGADEAEVHASASQGLSVNVRLGEVETLEYMQDRGVSVTVYDGRRKGVASSADLKPESIAECVRRATDIARYTQEDPCNGLADPGLLAREQPDLDLWHPVTMDATAAIERALACEEAGRSDSRISNSEGAGFEAALGLSVYGNSNGFIGRSAGTRYTQSCILLAGEGDGMQRDYAFDSRRCLGDLEGAAATGLEAARMTVARLGSGRLDTAEMPVLFAPRVATGLIGHLVGAVSGSALYRNASFLKGRAGDRLFPEWLDIEERPLLPRGAGSASFDAEGVATRRRKLVDAGVLTGYALSSYSARRLGLETTANAGGVRNLLLRPGGEVEGDLLSALDEGLYVTELMGQGVNLVTGDYSRGAAGFLVRNGAIVRPVEEVTVAGQLEQIFGDIVAAGNDIDTRGNLQCGSLLVRRMMVAGS
jgi:PmbA protein